MIPEYNPEELGRLQAAIEGLRYQDRETVEAVAAAMADGRCPEHLAPFWSLAAAGEGDSRGRDLLDKLSLDPLVPTYSLYGFFPEIFRRVYQVGERPEVTFDGRTRGPVALFRFSDDAGIVIKPWQNSREAAIAQLAGDARVGPCQLPSLDGFISEELVSGVFFTELASELLSDEFLYQIGTKLGEMIAALHAAHIYYNDATISDPEGRSHLLIELNNDGGHTTPDGARLIDFGVSALLDEHPVLELEEVYNIARTTPEFRILSRMGIQGAELRQFLGQYRQRLAAMPREEIQARDLRFTEEGLQQAARILGNDIIPPFREGFQKGYE